MALPDATVELVALIAKRTDKAEIVQQVLRAVLVVPVVVQEGGSPTDIAPFTLRKDGKEDVVAFATADAAEEMKDITTYFMTMSGTSLILRMPAGLGLLLFSSAGNVAFEPSLLADIRGDMRALADRDPEP
ncbi:MAG: hypothetical protein HGA51_10285 [Demequinaceae bacterium]|nr:hypothetical protein [Demequinaceae bacterium]